MSPVGMVSRRWLVASGAAFAIAWDVAPTQTLAVQTVAPLRVIASFSVLGDLVRLVGGDAIALDVVVGAGADAHTFEPNPATVARFAEADLIFENGLGFEPWLDPIVEASGSAARRVVVTDGLALRAAGEGHEGEEHAGATPGMDEDNAEEEHGEFDPHVWHDVRNAVAMVGTIRDALTEADPANAATYAANAAATFAELEALDAWVVEQVATLPEERRRLVTSHDTFGYFADRYGFEVIGTALGVSTEGGEPAAGEVAALVERIRAAGVPAIFADNVSNPDLMESIAAEAGVALAPPLYTDALGTEGSAGATYDGMMRSNATTIVTALAA